MKKWVLSRSMASQLELIALTPRGSSIYKLHSGGYRVCDPDHQCHVVQSLYKAEEVVRAIEVGFGYPYSSGFHEIVH